ncbi:MAG: rhodanese-like domain-containing protein [Peptococcaceae bacterium]|nr:rhodanese-like domain-containing protein [Peptococcaceae bacterium]
MSLLKKLFGIHTNIPTISPQEAYQMMNVSNEHILLDVRTASEYKEVRIDGAKLIPVDELSRRALAELPDKHRTVFIYCHSGARAAKAADLLVGMGYTKVFSFGGIVNWPYETING